MKPEGNIGRVKYYSCHKAIPVMVRYRASLLKYYLDRKKNRLFIDGVKNGLLKEMNDLRRRIKLMKFAKFDGSYFFSLTMPHWPSPAFDNMIAHGGLNMFSSRNMAKMQTDIAIIAITGKCVYNCMHCYERFNINENDALPVGTLKELTLKMQEKGTSNIVYSGGEPMLRYDDLLELISAGDHKRSDFHIHTSGHMVSSLRAKELRKAGLIAAGVGLDDFDPIRNDMFRGYSGAFEQAVDAIRYFSEAGIFPYVNACPTHELLRDGGLLKFMDLMKQLNVGIVRWLEPRPCGGFANCDDDRLLSGPDKEYLTETYVKLNSSPEYSDYPLVSYEAFMESPENMGCMMAGNSHFYIDSNGNVEPCVFFPVSFGNIRNEDFNMIFRKMRKTVPEPVHSACPSIKFNLYLKNRGNDHITFPIPFEDIKAEFSSILTNGK